MRLSARAKDKLWRLCIYTAATVTFILMGFPLYTLILTSLVTRAELFSRPLRWVPQDPTLIHFARVLEPDHVVPVGQAIFNSSVVAVGTALFALLLGSLAAYAFARLRFPFKAKLLSSLLAFYMLPSMLFLIPIFVIMIALNLFDTYLSLILPYTVWMLPFIVLILKAFFESIPQEIEESALVDGCSRLKAIRHIVAPLAAPGLAAAGIFAFILAWNEFLTPLVMTTKLVVITTALGLYRSTFDIEIGQMAAAAIYSLLPVVILTLVFQRYIVRGIVEGAVKG
jgi:ABC-type glycerol-3-phosphate transport system permease component